MRSLLWFTKFLKGLDAERVGAAAARAGFDGLDLAIRPGQCVQPSDARRTLPEAMAVWRSQGLRVELATLPGDAIDPGDPDTRGTLEACADAGIRLVKLGYWTWQPGEDYWKRVDAITAALAGFEAIARRLGITVLVHTHSDRYYGANAAGAALLVRRFDPKHVGIYLDPCHLALDGEPLDLALAIAGGHLAMVAVKNAHLLPAQRDAGGQRWTQDWCAASEGLVHWGDALRALDAVGYRGPLSLHGEYSQSEEREAVTRLVCEDLAFIRSLTPAQALAQGAR
ncbi:MAG: sugar phosphate isomerase/epimerase [Planctomycetes bacterium]|nr:sugar phosphate isomerase/epimerase [Planctomycetota bacterium]